MDLGIRVNSPDSFLMALLRALTRPIPVWGWSYYPDGCDASESREMGSTFTKEWRKRGKTMESKGGGLLPPL